MRPPVLRRGALGAGLVGALAIIGCTGHDEPNAPAWPGSVSQEGEVRVVHNPGTGVLDSARLQLREAWRFDPAADGGDSLVWARPSQIAAANDAFYIVDTPESHVYVLSASGAWTQTLGKQAPGRASSSAPPGSSSSASESR